MTHAHLALGAIASILCLLATASPAASLIGTNATWAFRNGLSEASSPDLTAWRTNGFNDSGFTNLPAPFTYGEGYTYGTVIAGMANSYSCFFLRRTFEIGNVADVAALRLGAKVDDGFVAWINGVEVQRVNMPGAPGSTVTITNLASGATEPVPFDFFTLNSPGAYLVPGTNTLAVQVFNTTLNSSDIVFDSSLDSIVVETNPPVIVAVAPPPNSVLTNLTQISVLFSEPVTGLNADDFNVNGLGAASVVNSGGTNWTFTFAQPAYGPVPITWTPGHGITDEAIPPNAFNDALPGATWTYALVDTTPPTVTGTFPPAGATVSALGQIEVTFSEAVLGLSAADLLINGQPATNLVTQPNSVFLFQFPPQPAGPVLVQWTGGHGIVDPATNAFAGGSWSYTVNPNANANGLVINEINASNESGLADENGDREDWIELFNGGTNAVNLAGWSLSDDLEEPGRWIFPSRLIAPGEYLVIFCSGKDRRTPTGTNRFHTSFKLAGDGEFLGLFSPDSPRQLVSGFAPKFPEQRNDVSYGLSPAGLRYFGTPTPGASNGVSTIVDVVEPVHFSTARGHFTQPFTLVLSCATRGSAIRFTLDGSVPTPTNGLAYTNAIPVNNSLFIRAAAFHTNQLPSKVATHSYLFNQAAAIRSLPVISIQTASNNLHGPTGIIGMSGGTGPPANPWTALTTNDYHNFTKKGIEWEKPVSVEWIDPADNSGFHVDAGLRVQGSDYTRPRYQPTDKISYRLYFRGDYGAGTLDHPFFSDAAVQSFDQIVLRAGHNDISNPFLRDELARQLSADMGQVACHGNWANYFLNGVYKGYYNPTERVEEEFLQAWHGGSNSWDVLTVGSAVQGGDAIEWNSLRSYVSSQDVTQPAIYNEILRRMDLVNFIDYLLVNVYGCTWDWPHNNWRAARERAPGGKFRFYVWDAEGAFGEFDGRTANSDSFTGVTSPLLNGAAEIPTFYTRLRNSAEFRLLWADRVQRHFFNAGAMTDSNITARFVQMRGELSGVIPAMNNNILNAFIPFRRTPLFNQFNSYGLYASNAPVFNQHGSNVPPGFNLAMSAPQGGTIYFTTNGGDPRVMFTGAVSNSAVAYAGPVVLNQNTLVKARTLNGTNWSALTEATFTVSGRGVSLRITEINYNPPGGTAHEFIELQNIGAALVTLDGMSFEGVAYTFPVGRSLAGGARLVLAADFNPAAFAAQYPGVTVAGYYSGSLNNGGERLVLKDPSGNIITSVDYKDGGGWPLAADGGGASLENINPAGDPDDPASWRASGAVGGSPGAANASPAPSPVVLNEVLAENLGAVNHGGTWPDFVELANTTGALVDVSGWSLTDDGNARKFILPPGTMIAANGFLTIWCDAATNTTPGLHSGFALGRNGDNVYLFDASTNLADALSFGLQVGDYSVGRVGGTWVLNTPTTNAPNLAASLGSAGALSINEFLANAPAGSPDWIELYNNSALPVPLRGTFLSNTSAVHQIASLSFIAPFGYAQLFADEGVGADHLDFKLAAAGGAIVLYDGAGNEVNQVGYPAQSEGVTRGRLPDGSINLVNFPGSASPGTTNYAATYTGPVVNEIMARNDSAHTNAQGRVADYLELFNGGGAPFSLAGFSLSVNSAAAGQWLFPPGASVPALGYLVIYCDDGLPVSTNNTGRALDGDSGGVYLFNAAGQLVNSVEYGFQITNRAIGLVGGAWRLLAANSPGSANGASASLAGPNLLRINEWMADAAEGPDWFEIFNATNLPVDLAGLVLTDDLTSAGTNEFRLPALSFIAPGGFVRCVADGQTDQGRDHVSFDLDAQGESIRIYASNSSTILDTVVFGVQGPGLAQGRLPDGGTNVFSFPGSASPGEPNYRLLAGVVINEVLTHPASPAEQMIELHNTSGYDLNVGGWFLSDSVSSLKKFRFADGIMIAAGGFITVSDTNFGTPPNVFQLDRARGGELWLSSADAATNLTGFRTGVKFGAADAGVSFGRHLVAGRADFVPQAALTSGATNSVPLVGPVVINEIMYHPPDGLAGATEFIELRNIAPTNVNLFDPGRPTNTWRLGDGISFSFPPGVTLGAGGYALVVNFDPSLDPGQLADFSAHYGVPPGVPVFGPYSGQLDNGGETIDLFRPGLPDGAFLPYVRIDKVAYRDAAPWPDGAVDGGGLSLQRRQSSAYGDDPSNWAADAPTAGGPNSAGLVAPPTMVQSPAGTNVFANTDVVLQAAAAGPGPISWQWRFNGAELEGQTNAILYLEALRLDDTGTYDVFARNDGGSVISAPAQVTVVEAAYIMAGLPAVYGTNAGSNATFSVTAGGSGPLVYQWRSNGVDIVGAVTPTLSLTNLALHNSAVYSLTVTNPYGTATSSVTLQVLVRPGITNHPVAQFVLRGGTAVFSVMAGPSHPLVPLTYRWLTNGVGMTTNLTGVLVLTNVQLGYNQVRCVVVNGAGTANSTSVALVLLADSDQDGLGDNWEAIYFGAASTNDNSNALLDPDGDGMNNRDEFLAGTNPTNALSVLKVSFASANPALLEFVAQTNLSYTVQVRADLAGAPWVNMTNIYPSSLVRTAQVNAVVVPGPVERYYRAVTPAFVSP